MTIDPMWIAIFAILFGLAVFRSWELHQEFSNVHDVAFGRESRGNLSQLPAKPPTRWLLGRDRILEIWRANTDGHLLAELTAIAKTYGPGNDLYQYLLVGPRRLHIWHYADIETILSAKFLDFGFGCRSAVFGPLLGNGVGSQQGDPWKHSGEILERLFTRMQSKDVECFKRHVDHFISCLPTISSTIDLQPLFFSLSLNVAASTLFGKSLHTLQSRISGQAAESREFAEAFDTAQEGLAKRFHILPFHFLYNPPSFQNAYLKVHELVSLYIQEAARMADEQLGGEEEDEDNDPLWFIWQLAQKSSSKAELRDQLLNVLLAGRDTIACCLSWTLRLLVRHPQVMSRLRSEIALVMPSTANPSPEQIKRIKFLSCVIQESLRLYPPIPLSVRQALSTTTLPTGGGPDGKSPVVVRKGEYVAFSSYVNSRLERTFGPDAEKFRPERWETGELGLLGWKDFPFSDGVRKSSSVEFAIMEVSYTIVRLLQTFPVIELPEAEVNEPVGTEKQKLTLFLSPTDGCKVSISSAKPVVDRRLDESGSGCVLPGDVFPQV